MQGQVDLSSLNFYTTLGQLAPTELGLDAEGDVSALATYYDIDGSEKTVVLVIRASGGFQVYNIIGVPMDHPVVKAKLMMIAAPIMEDDAAELDRQRAAEEGLDRAFDNDPLQTGNLPEGVD